MVHHCLNLQNYVQSPLIGLVSTAVAAACSSSFLLKAGVLEFKAEAALSSAFRFYPGCKPSDLVQVRDRFQKSASERTSWPRALQTPATVQTAMCGAHLRSSVAQDLSEAKHHQKHAGAHLIVLIKAATSLRRVQWFASQKQLSVRKL